MPEGTVIGHVHLFVGDLDRAAAFYHAGLGLDKIVWSYPGALFMSAGGYHHHLGTNTWAAGAPPAGPDDARLLEWEMVVPTAGDAADALASLERAGASVDRSGDGGVVRDPWGTALRVRPEAGH
jgi:catechol 2,3-dioxygenase